MRYVKISEIVEGDRFAKPIYNREGVLLFNSGVKADATILEKLQALNLYGTYLLDAAEPVPPITNEELEFERFQWVQTYVVNEILGEIIKNKVPVKLDDLVALIYNRFGNRNKKMIFNQCLRGENDFVSKHALNVAILSTMLARKMNLDYKECTYLIQAALFHDIGKLLVPPALLHKESGLEPGEIDKIHRCLLDGFNLLCNNYDYPSGVRRYLIQLSKDLTNRLPQYLHYDQNLLPGTKVIQVADIYDTLTAVRPYKSPMSAFSAVQIMRKEAEKYDANVIDVLEECIHILPTGSYVMLSNGEQGIVTRENQKTLERPVVLGLMSNKLYDLGQHDVYKQIQIVDTVFTPDNRQQVEIDVSKLVKK